MKKNIILMALAVAAFAACDKSVPYEPGAPMNLDNPNVYFSAYNSTKTVLASDATEFEVAILRDDVETALTLPLKGACPYEGIFTVPETVEFAAGVDSVSFKVQVSDKIEMFKDYQLYISIPEEYTHAYLPSETTGPRFIANVVKEDYVPYAEGAWFDFFFTGQGWNVVLEYSAMKKEYRLSDVWAPLGTGSTTDITFSWDGSEKVTMGANSYPTGVPYSSYGPVTAAVVAGCATYGNIPADELYEGSPALPGFIFDFKWTVSAGSFGQGYPQIYAITKVL